MAQWNFPTKVLITPTTHTNINLFSLNDDLGHYCCLERGLCFSKYKLTYPYNLVEKFSKEIVERGRPRVEGFE